jgi:hypothetical protein
MAFGIGLANWLAFGRVNVCAAGPLLRAMSPLSTPFDYLLDFTKHGCPHFLR